MVRVFGRANIMHPLSWGGGGGGTNGKDLSDLKKLLVFKKFKDKKCI